MHKQHLDQLEPASPVHNKIAETEYVMTKSTKHELRILDRMQKQQCLHSAIHALQQVNY